MKLFKSLIAAGVVAATLGLAAAANASITFVGSWAPSDSTTSWSSSPPNGPLAYTGQEAAALLFGGVASDYYISTVDDLVANINHMAWYDVIGVGGNVFAENYNNKYLGQFYGPTSGYNCCGEDFAGVNAASAYIHDNGVSGRNYAFRVDGAVPEPASWALMITGFGLAGVTMRRRRSVAATA